MNPSEILEQEIIDKQTYLRDQIIEGELDPYDFKEFCDSLRPNGILLNIKFIIILIRWQ